MVAAGGNEAVRAVSSALLVTASAIALQAQPTFRGGVDLVLLDVSVTRGGAPVSGLAAGDFIVLDNGTEQEIQSATLETLPLDVQLVLDVSGSVAGERQAHLIAAGTGLLQSLRPDDRVGLITFSEVLDSRASAMTSNFASVRRALAGIAPSGQTALRDAVSMGLTMERVAERRPLMLAFTDGVDNASWLSEEEALEAARRAGVVIHVVRVSGRERSPSTFVEDLTQSTGGRVWSGTSSRDMASLFTKALDEMRARYLLTFSPRGPAHAGWHEVRVRVKNGKGEVRARPGYFVNQ